MSIVSKLHDPTRPTVFGTCILSPSPSFLPVAVACNLDFLFLDTEHVPIDRHQLSWMCRAYAAAGIPCIVRVPSVLDASGSATQVLDGGAVGVVAPYIETVDQVIEVSFLFVCLFVLFVCLFVLMLLFLWCFFVMDTC